MVNIFLILPFSMSSNLIHKLVCFFLFFFHHPFITISRKPVCLACQSLSTCFATWKFSNHVIDIEWISLGIIFLIDSNFKSSLGKCFVQVILCRISLVLQVSDFKISLQYIVVLFLQVDLNHIAISISGYALFDYKLGIILLIDGIKIFHIYHA